MSLSIAGKTAIVTGAASGVGLSIGRHFVENGANVVFADADPARLRDEVGRLEDEGEGAARVFACDLRERLALANLLSTAIDAFDRVDVLVNAQREVAMGDPLDPEDDAVETLIQQNLITALRLSQLTAKRMIAQAGEDGEGGAGAIVNLSSIAARRTHPGLLAYSVSMAALDQMTRSMAVALAPRRIRVNAVAFGSVMSASLKGALKGHSEIRQDITGHTPIGRIAAPSEVAEAVQFLASDGAGFVTGQILTVDGGRTLIDPVGAPAH